MTPIHESKAPTAEEMAFAMGGASTSALNAAAVEPARAAPAVRWLTDKKRVESYELLFPFALDGVEYRVVTVKRLQAAEVEAFMEKMRAGKSGARFPLYFVGDVELPDAIWDALDDDDRFALGEIGSDFLPARFRQKTEADEG